MQNNAERSKLVVRAFINEEKEPYLFQYTAENVLEVLVFISSIIQTRVLQILDDDAAKSTPGSHFAAAHLVYSELTRPSHGSVRAAELFFLPRAESRCGSGHCS